MSDGLPPIAVRIVARGSFCHVSAATGQGPHVTPMVFAAAGGRLWVTTSRASVKARGWRRDPRVAGLVRAGDAAVAFTGRVRTFDALDPASWGRSVREGPLLAIASARFTRKNARFFAGYAVDANRVPLAWTPPGRVFVELDAERTALLSDDGVGDSWGAWEPDLLSREVFRAIRTGGDPLDGLPADVRDALGRSGSGAVAVEGADGVVVLPAAWTMDGASLYAVLHEDLLALARCRSPSARVALEVDRPSWWRARDMVGAMVRGEGEVFAVGRLSTGRRSADRVAQLAGVDPKGAALVRVRPRRLVWWRGWSSGTVAAT